MPQQKTETITLTPEKMRELGPDRLNELLLKAVKISGTAVVRRADGSIKYDNPELAGNFGEQYLEDPHHDRANPRPGD